MKKSLSVTVFLLLGAGLAFGQNKLRISSDSAAAGSSVDMPVSVTTDSSLGAISFSAGFDQARLEIAGVALGIGIAGLMPVGVDLNEANSSGRLRVMLIDSSLIHPIPPGSGIQVFVITFRILPGASGLLPLTVDSVSVSDELGNEVSITPAAGSITVLPAPPPAKNSIRLAGASGAVGEDVVVSVLAFTDSAITNAGFTVVFDPQMLQLNADSTGKGLDDSAMDLDPPDIAGANSTGRLEVQLDGTSGTDSVPGGAERELFRLQFNITGAASGVIPLFLDSVSLKNPGSRPILVQAVSGEVSVTGGGAVIPPTLPSNRNVLADHTVQGLNGYDIHTTIDMNAIQPVAAVSFRVTFDRNLVRVNNVTPVGMASGMTLVGFDPFKANGNGYFDVVLQDLTGTHSFPGGFGSILDVSLTFVADGTLLFGISNLQASDPAARTLTFVVWNDVTPVDRENPAGAGLPRAFSLAQNSPNPFNPSTTIVYQVGGDGASASRVIIRVFNLRGQRIATLVDGVKPAGRYAIEWDGSGEGGVRLPSGAYFYRMQSGDFIQTRKMVLLK
jgi:hypothetical protein